MPPRKRQRVAPRKKGRQAVCRRTWLDALRGNGGVDWDVLAECLESAPQQHATPPLALQEAVARAPTLLRQHRHLELALRLQAISAPQAYDLLLTAASEGGVRESRLLLVLLAPSEQRQLLTAVCRARQARSLRTLLEVGVLDNVTGLEEITAAIAVLTTPEEDDMWRLSLGQRKEEKASVWREGWRILLRSKELQRQWPTWFDAIVASGGAPSVARQLSRTTRYAAAMLAEAWGVLPRTAWERCWAAREPAACDTRCFQRAVADHYDAGAWRRVMESTLYGTDLHPTGDMAPGEVGAFRVTLERLRNWRGVMVLASAQPHWHAFSPVICHYASLPEELGVLLLEEAVAFPARAGPRRAVTHVMVSSCGGEFVERTMQVLVRLDVHPAAVARPCFAIDDDRRFEAALEGGYAVAMLRLLLRLLHGWPLLRLQWDRVLRALQPHLRGASPAFLDVLLRHGHCAASRLWHASDGTAEGMEGKGEFLRDFYGPSSDMVLHKPPEVVPQAAMNALQVGTTVPALEAVAALLAADGGVTEEEAERGAEPRAPQGGVQEPVAECSDTKQAEPVVEDLVAVPRAALEQLLDACTDPITHELIPPSHALLIAPPMPEWNPEPGSHGAPLPLPKAIPVHSYLYDAAALGQWTRTRVKQGRGPIAPVTREPLGSFPLESCAIAVQGAMSRVLSAAAQVAPYVGSMGSGVPGRR